MQYGVEPFSYYVKNLFVNFNVAWPLSLFGDEFVRICVPRVVKGNVAHPYARTALPLLCVRLFVARRRRLINATNNNDDDDDDNDGDLKLLKARVLTLSVPLLWFAIMMSQPVS